MAACEESASGSAKSKKKAVCWKYFEKISNSESTSNGKTKCRVTCNFCGEELAYHGATSTMNEHLKRKHPVETDQAPKPKQLKLDTYTARKTCTKERSNHINMLVMGMIVRDLRPLKLYREWCRIQGAPVQLTSCHCSINRVVVKTASRLVD